MPVRDNTHTHTHRVSNTLVGLEGGCQLLLLFHLANFPPGKISPKHRIIISQQIYAHLPLDAMQMRFVSAELSANSTRMPLSGQQTETATQRGRGRQRGGETGSRSKVNIFSMSMPSIALCKIYANAINTKLGLQETQKSQRATLEMKLSGRE